MKFKIMTQIVLILALAIAPIIIQVEIKKIESKSIESVISVVVPKQDKLEIKTEIPSYTPTSYGFIVEESTEFNSLLEQGYTKESALKCLNNEPSIFQDWAGNLTDICEKYK